MKKGRDIFLQTLLQEGVEYIFGNPGTTEAPLTDALDAYPQIKYIMTLHEGAATGIADAYSYTTNRLSVVNVHITSGLGNAIGMLYNAWIGHSPLLITAGQQDTRLLLREPLIYHDLVSLAAPVTKWSVQANSADELPLLLFRAIRTAKENPSGPVFVSLPMNVMEQTSAAPLMAQTPTLAALNPDPVDVDRIVNLILQSKKPAMIIGDETYRLRVGKPVVALAEAMGAPVFSTMIAAGVSMPISHPNYRGELPDNYQEMLPCLGESDFVLMVGGDFFREVMFTTANPWGDKTKLAEIETTCGALGKNFSLDAGMAADLAEGLDLVTRRLKELESPTYRETTRKRNADLAQERIEQEKTKTEKINNIPSDRMKSPLVMREIQRALPPETIVVGEAITNSWEMVSAMNFQNPGDYLCSRGGGVGQGLPGGIGVKLAYPERPVVVISGDGSALFSIQALWTAAHYRIPVVFIILHNRVYNILKINTNRFRRFYFNGENKAFPMMDLQNPDLNFAALAEGFGVESVAINSIGEIYPAVSKAIQKDRPVLIDLAIEV